MKLLHTSDWHLGQSFMGQSREAEHKAFLEWLLRSIEEEGITLLIVAGDIFDTGTPPNYALELYYTFLTKLSKICQNIIITAGNHDSIATLKAPKQLLKALNVHVITTGDRDEEEVIKIYENKKLQGIVCGVPFLRDYVVREALSGESLHEKEHSLTQGIQEHYKQVHKEALTLVKDEKIPIIATGHLTTVGAKTSESEREIYIGGTLDVDSGFLSSMFDYVALGHLHINQKVGSKNVRYSGSPIPLSFSESSSQKKVNIVTFAGLNIDVKELDVPLYRKLMVVKGDVEQVLEVLESVQNKKTWIEVELKDKNPFHANQVIRERAKELGLSILALKIDKTQQKLQAKEFNVISLDELTPLEVFEKRLEKDKEVNIEFQKQLLFQFKEVLQEVQNG